MRAVGLLRSLARPWTWRMAWRDVRHAWRRLLLYVGSIVAGVAALVAIASFQANLEAAIEQRSRSLLGADLAFSSPRPLTPEAAELVGSVDGRRSRQVEFSSMARFPATDGSRLVSVRALEGDFPYYGEMVTRPPGAAGSFRTGRGALVERTLALQFGVEPGDRLRLGQVTFRIEGILEEVPGELPAMALVSPRVYIPLGRLDETGLIRRGSRATWTTFVALSPGTDPGAVVERLRPGLRTLPQRLSLDTVERRRRSVGSALSDLNRFLALVGFVALLLGGVGVASSVHLYVSNKVGTVAILRCLGASSRQALAIFLVQTAGMGVLGAGLGALLGVAVQRILPRVLRGLLPADIPFFLSWPSIVGGVTAGAVVALLFGLLPLVSIRRVSPLSALREVDEADLGRRRDPLRWGLGALLAVACGAVVVAGSPSPGIGLGISAGIVGVFAILALVARALMALARRLAVDALPYELRQGLANLHRPHNQTGVLLLSLGLVTFLVLTLFLVQSSLLARIEAFVGERQGDLVAWDVQTDQLGGVREIFRDVGVRLERQMPIVAMRLQEVDGTPVEDLLGDRARTTDPGGDGRRPTGRWALRWDYSSTYRAELTPSEEIVAGEWVGRVTRAGEPPPVSLDVQVAEDLDLSVGDELVFDIQGVSVPVVVGSLRRVEWDQDPPNFLVLFPEGALEGAPQFHVVVGRAGSAAASAELQRRLVRRFPNVSIVDLQLVMKTVDAVLDEIAFVLRFMAMFSVATGLLVLSAAVVASRFQRLREGVLLRTLGASRGQIRGILVAEYAFLGLLGATTGAILSVAGAWLLSRFVFEVELGLPVVPVALTALAVATLTVAVGMLHSRGIVRRPPLEVLRVEAG